MPDISLPGILHDIADYFLPYFSYFFSVFLDNKLLAFISYLGIILTVYYSLRAPHKSIRYAVAQGHNEYIVAFWNACSRPIFKEDVFALCLFADGDFVCRKVYQNMYEAPLELPRGKSFVSHDEQLDAEFDYPVIRMDLSFDFLNRRRGYIVLVSSDQHSARPLTALSMYGKLRGEPPTSVRHIKPKFLSGWGEFFKSLLWELFRTVVCVFGGLFYIYAGIIESNHTETWTGTLILILFLLMVLKDYHLCTQTECPFRCAAYIRDFSAQTSGKYGLGLSAQNTIFINPDAYQKQKAAPVMGGVNQL